MFITFFGFWFWTFSFQIIDIACKIWHDVKIPWYFLEFENNSPWIYNFYSMDKSQYFTVEHVLNCFICTSTQYINRIGTKIVLMDQSATPTFMVIPFFTSHRHFHLILNISYQVVNIVFPKVSNFCINPKPQKCAVFEGMYMHAYLYHWLMNKHALS